MSSTWTWVAGIIITLGLIVGIVAFDTNQQQKAITVPSEVATVGIDEWTKGPENAPVTLIEYADFQCPACRLTATVVQQVYDAYPDDLRLVFRLFPLTSIHQNAALSAQAAVAAGEQGKFWEMHNLLYETQGDWSQADDVQSIFIEDAQKLGLEVEKFTTDLTSETIVKKVKENEQAAINAKIDATPTFIMNGKIIQNPGSFEDFKTLIDSELGR